MQLIESPDKVELKSKLLGKDEQFIKQIVLSVFNYRCAICGGRAVTCHEIIPRSRGKKSLEFENRIAICNDCHDEEHRLGASPIRINSLQETRKNYLISIGEERYV